MTDESRRGPGSLHRPASAIAAGGSAALTLPSGHRIETEPAFGGEDLVHIRAPDGACVLSVRLTPEGPVLCFSGASLEVTATRTLSLECEDLRVRARGNASVEVGGDLAERVGGDATRAALGMVRTVARAVALEASPGGISITANDDVSVVGERVRLNSEDPPMPLTWEEHQERRARAELAARSGDTDEAGEASERVPSRSADEAAR